MSLLEKYLAGVGFRTNTPDFDVGDEITVFVTGYNGETPVVRIGDTVLRVEDAPPEAIDARVRLRVESFDDNDHTGTASYLERIGDSAF